MTKTEQAILELSKLVSKLEERSDSARAEIKDVRSEIGENEARRSRTTDLLNDVDRRLSVLEEAFKDLKKESEQKDSRRWMIVVAVISCLLTLLTQAILAYLKTNK